MDHDSHSCVFPIREDKNIFIYNKEDCIFVNPPTIPMLCTIYSIFEYLQSYAWCLIPVTVVPPVPLYGLSLPACPCKAHYDVNSCMNENRKVL